MIQIHYTQQDIEIFKTERRNHPHPRVEQRMDVLWLKSNGLPHNQIAKLAGVCQNTVVQYLRMFNEGGVEKLREINFYRPDSELTQHTSTIEAYFKEHPPASIKEAMSKIEELTGVKRGVTQVRKFLEKSGLKRRKVGTIPAKADLEKQEEFKKKNSNHA